MGGQPGDLKRGFGDTQGRRTEAHRAGALEAARAVVVRGTLQEHQRHAPTVGRVEGMGDEPGTDALALELRDHAQR
ncbi:hypothetical protein ACH4M4_22330 [Streptomyces sp. NPDC017254]|uniref:hypothetical protein n=1 Tax=unclassified Streptomyces TaxID=2593676 RepID=UPI0037B181A1